MDNSQTIQEAISRLLETEPGADQTDLAQLIPYIYDELREIAHRQLRKERQNHTFGTTALVNEAYLKLAGDAGISARGRAYFFGAAARTMREILVDYARQRNRAKRGAGIPHTTYKPDHIQVDEFAGDILDLNEALQNLEQLNPRHTRVVECRYFGGLSVEETALALDVSPRTVKQDWALAKAWLYRKLKDDQ